MAIDATIRQQLFDLLSCHTLDSRALSQQLGIAEKEVLAHLPHVAKTAKARQKRLVIDASQCQQCGFRFQDRARFTKPGRCPRCKSTHLTAPLFSLK